MLCLRTMIVRMKYFSGNRVTQVYMKYFVNFSIYALPHRRNSHTSLYRYFIYSGLPGQLYSDNSWDITNIRKWKEILDEEVLINISQIELHSPLHKNTRGIFNSCRVFPYIMLNKMMPPSICVTINLYIILRYAHVWIGQIIPGSRKFH